MTDKPDGGLERRRGTPAEGRQPQVRVEITGSSSTHDSRVGGIGGQVMDGLEEIARAEGYETATLSIGPIGPIGPIGAAPTARPAGGGGGGD